MERLVEVSLAHQIGVAWISHRDVEDPRAGGAEKVAFEVLKRLAREGMSVTWLSTTITETGPRVDIDGVKVIRLGTPVFAHFVWPAVARLMGQVDFVVDDLGHVVPWGSELVTNASGVAYFQHLHRRTLPGQVGPALASILTWVESTYPRAYPTWPFVTISRSSARDLEKLGVSRTRISIIPPGVDCAEFSPATRSPQPTLVYFGGLRAYKRPLLCLSVLQEVRRRGVDARLLVIGRGGLEPDMRRKADSMGLSDRVEFLGRLDKRSLVAAIQQSWVNLHCSVAEGWCLSAIEAASCGVPTAAFSVPGIEESVASGRSGLLAPDGDVTSLSDNAEKLIQSIESFSGSAREWAKLFDWQRTTDSWVRMIQEATTSRNCPS